AIVHVRRPQSDAAQRRRLELAAVVLCLSDSKPTQIFQGAAPTHAGVMESLIREIRTGMATPALTFAFVQPKAVPLSRRHCLMLAALAETIDRAIGTKQGALEAGQSLGQVRGRHAI